MSKCGDSRTPFFVNTEKLMSTGCEGRDLNPYLAYKAIEF